MCVYCFIADWMREYSPWKPPSSEPFTIPVQPWSPWSPYPTGPIHPLPSPWQPAPTPPVGPTPIPTPQPIHPIDNPNEGTTWTRKQLDEALEILRKVKEMEDALGGCPCEEPSKMNFLEEIRARLDRIEAAQKADRDGESATDAESNSSSASEQISDRGTD